MSKDERKSMLIGASWALFVLLLVGLIMEVWL